ncbi:MULTISPECIES: 5-dehydro-2-deoxygluconokinase [unclassified Aeromicrobium]|uniref:5-dehydro-2-deoxygluconokinase n=1 Tax=unclassified Aeromicrobium TaxID=2633570 RepID=UPI0006F554C0|nr:MULTISPECIES: 5-dehydro-2-deoxygluconokinase [unclassified Aeromicrobium]KQP26022.1 5-dehydro-2-deoxygluconokinase [Aeromicrobium sp. Leaf272]KQP75379.1 5-dehydro-2-deoxygluconokinase [Aeromicrobium sp. Leaf289]RYY43254.1 MAG: 5-dehydro-2-deoxygluconokinase [Actinomycetales bacterium]
MSTIPEVLTYGRAGVDVYPLQIGVGLEDVESFGKFLGGTTANVAVAAARLGHRVAALTGVGDDPFGRFVRRAFRDLGVDDSHVVVVPELATPVTFCEIFPPDDFPLYFYRKPSAPDMNLTVDQVDLELVRAVDLLWVTTSGMSEEPSRSTQLAMLEARSSAGVPGHGRHDGSARQDRHHTVLDLDYRPMFWSDPADATVQVQKMLPHVSVAVGNREECEVAVGETDPDRAADALLDAGVELAVVKQGPKGVLAKTRHERVESPPILIEPVNGLGAGDSFGGSLVHGLLAGLPLEQLLRNANAAGAIVASRLECSTAMPTQDEIDELVRERFPQES